MQVMAATIDHQLFAALAAPSDLDGARLLVAEALAR